MTDTPETPAAPVRIGPRSLREKLRGWRWMVAAPVVALVLAVLPVGLLVFFAEDRMEFVEATSALRKQEREKRISSEEFRERFKALGKPPYPFGIFGILGVVGGLIGLRAARRGWKKRWSHVAAGAVATLVGGIGGGLSVWFAMVTDMTWFRGRQLRAGGKTLLPSTTGTSGWAIGALHPSVPDEKRAEVARAWRHNAATEHASIAAFSRLSLDLMALGAPPSLVEDAHRDALDEARHARSCYALAAGVDGNADGPAPFPEVWKPREGALSVENLAVEALREGALLEDVAARTARSLSTRDDVDPVVREVLRGIAEDEARHAEHAWDVMLWCVRKGGVSVVTALEHAMAGFPERLVLEACADGALERWGIPGQARVDVVYAACRSACAERLSALVTTENRQPLIS